MTTMNAKKICPITHNSDLDIFLNRESRIIEETMYFRKQQDDETIELLVKRGVIYYER